MKKDGGRFHPTELGEIVTELLVENFDHIFDISYTARMEEELDEIEEGKIDWRVAMQEFYEQLKQDLEHAERNMTDIKRMEKPTDLICEKCGKPMVIKWGAMEASSHALGIPNAPIRGRSLRNLVRSPRARKSTARTAVARWF